MLIELTLISTIAIHHILLGLGLLLVLSIIIKVTKISPELQSWLWLTAFAVATLLPFSLMDSSVPAKIQNSQKVTQIKTKTNQLEFTRNKNGDFNILLQKNGYAENQPEWHLPSHFVFKVENLLLAAIAIWLIGSIWRLTQMGLAYRRTRSLIRDTTELPSKHPITQYSDSKILISNQTSSPMTSGLLTPVILLPDSLVKNLTNQQLAPVILHENAHIQRGDLWFSIFQELIAIIFWWSPAIRWLNRRIHISRELACDIRAARQLNSGKVYAQSLLDCAKLMLTRRQNILAMSLFSRRKDLNHRVNEVLRSHSYQTPRTILTSFTCLLLSIATIAAATSYAPRINLASIEKHSKYFVSMTKAQRERLLAAIAEEDLITIEKMQAEGLDINTPVDGDGTALMLAIKDNNLRLTRALVRLGADVNQASLGDGSPLIIAARRNKLGIAKYLIAEGADVNQAVPGDGSPLIVAANRNNLQMAKYLISTGADVNKAVLRDGNPLIGAAKNNHLQMAKYLVAEGADVNAIVKYDETPLINAARHGYFEMTQWLVASGADVNLEILTGPGDGYKLRSPLNMARTQKIRDFLKTRGAVN